MFRKKILCIFGQNEELIKRELNSLQWGSIKVVFFQEDIYIDTLCIPMVKSRWINNMIKNHLLYNFDEIEKLCYSYDVVSKSSKKLCIRLYCINARNSFIFEELKKSVRITGIYLIQFCYLNFVQKQLGLKDFILVFSSRGSIYVEFFSNGSLLVNYCFKEGAEENYEFINEKIIDEFISCYKQLSSEKAALIALNLIEQGLLKILSDYFQTSKVVNLGYISEEKIIKKYVGGM